MVVPLAGRSPEERAAEATKAIEHLLDESEEPEVRVQEEGDVAVVYGGKSPIIQLGAEDAAAAGDATAGVHARDIAAKIRAALRAERQRSAIATTVFAFSLLVFSGLIAFLLVRKVGELFERLRGWLDANPGKLPALRVRGIEVVQPAAVRGGIGVALGGANLVARIGIFYAWVLIALSLFDATRGYSERLTGFVLKPVSEMMGRVASALPLLVIALVTMLAVGVSLRFVRLFFGSMARGETTVGWMPRDLAEPTSILVRAGIVVTTLVVAAPLITGSDDGTLSRAGVVALVAIGLSATPLLACAAVGIAVVFGRRLRVGDRAGVGGREGRVRALSMLEVLIEDDQGCAVHVPHLLSLWHPTRVVGAGAAGRGRAQRRRRERSRPRGRADAQDRRHAGRAPPRRRDRARRRRRARPRRRDAAGGDRPERALLRALGGAPGGGRGARAPRPGGAGGVSSLWLLMGLLVLSYAGSFLVGSRAVRGGLPAGTEYVILGFVLGPSALGLVERSMLATVEPMAHAALGWLAFVLGLQYGINGGRRVRTVRMLGSWVAFLFTGAAIAAAVWGVLRLFAPPGALGDRDRLLVAGGVGAATAETTRYAVRWVVDRVRASGPFADLVGDLAESDDLVPFFMVAALFAWSPERDLPLAFRTPWIWFAVTLGLGALLGGMAAVLLGRTFRLAEAWAVMLGMSMLTIGTASRIGLAGVAAMFVMGTAISALSPHRADITAMMAPTERPVMLPALLLAGAGVDFNGGARWLPWVLVAAVLARVGAKFLVGLAVLAVVPKARRAGPQLGLGLSSAGALSMSIGLTFALRFRGPVGGAVLAAAALATVVGEILGPASLRACLRRAGGSRTRRPPEPGGPPTARRPRRRRPRPARRGGALVSTAAAAPKTAGARVAQAAVLVLLFALFYGATRLMPHGGERGSLVAATGFLLVAGTLLSELVEVIGLPHLSGYLLAGILAGPHVYFHFIDHETVESLTSINALALALIALEGGAELKLTILRQVWKSLAIATIFQSLPILLLMAGVFIAARPIVPFLKELSPGALVGAGLLWGAVAITRSPSATLGILSQTRASGPLARYTLTFVMTSDVVVVVLVAVTMMIARPLMEPAASFSMRELGTLGHELFGSVALGTTLGLTLAAYLRLVGKQLSLVFVALGFGVTEVLGYLRFDALLTFMVAGFVVQNLSRQGEKLTRAIGEMGSLVYVVFFATAGAHLDVPLLRKLWPVALILASSRALFTFVAARAACRVAGDPPAVRRWGWSGLVSQAGLALGLAGLIAAVVPHVRRPASARWPSPPWRSTR